MKKNKLKLFGYGALLLIIVMYGLLYLEFKRADDLTASLEKNGYVKRGTGKLSFINDGLLYFFTKSNRKKLALYTKNLDENIFITTSILIEASRSNKGSSSYFPSLGARVRIQGRKDKFHYIKDFQCTDGNYTVRNSKYEESGSFLGGAELSNGIPVDGCYSENVVQILDSLPAEPKFKFLPTTVWYPQKGQVNTRVNLGSYKDFDHDLKSLLTVYKALTQ